MGRCNIASASSEDTEFADGKVQGGSAVRSGCVRGGQGKGWNWIESIIVLREGSIDSRRRS